MVELLYDQHIRNKFNLKIYFCDLYVYSMYLICSTYMLTVVVKVFPNRIIPVSVVAADQLDNIRSPHARHFMQLLRGYVIFP